MPTKAPVSAPSGTDLDFLVGARHHDPFGVLGLHREGKGWVLRVLRPYASAVEVHTLTGFVTMEKIHQDGVFAWRGAKPPPQPVRLRVNEAERDFEIFDPYGFRPLISADRRSPGASPRARANPSLTIT